VVFRFCHFAVTASELVARIEAHMLEDAEQEIDGVVVIRSSDRSAHNYNPQMFPILDWHFGPHRR
jgi:hypothetical protein